MRVIIAHLLDSCRSFGPEQRNTRGDDRQLSQNEEQKNLIFTREVKDQVY